MSSQRLYRSIRDKKITGLCGGLADYFNIDPTLIRLVVAIAAVFSGGTVLLVYIIASMVIPKEPRYGDPFDPYYRPTGHYGPHGHHSHHGSFGGGFGDKHYGSRPQQPSGQYRQPYEPNAASSSSNIDEMMREVEKKAMKKEIEELKAKLAQLEKNTKDHNKGDV